LAKGKKELEQKIRHISEVMTIFGDFRQFSAEKIGVFT
jgi:hypothetical protein